MFVVFCVLAGAGFFAFFFCNPVLRSNWFGKIEDAARFREHEEVSHILWSCNFLWFEALRYFDGRQ